MEVVAKAPKYRQLAWLIWLALALAMSAIVVSDLVNNKPERSVTTSYRLAVENWFSGKPLYNMGGSGFIYMPQAALVFAPWGLLPKPVGEVLWRLTILGAMGLGVDRLTRLFSSDARWFLVNTVASAAMAAGCARNGQSTLIITGLMLLATVDLVDKKWWRATILLSLAFAFKPVSIVLVLLAAAIYPQMLWRLIVGMLIVGIFPFLTQRPDYVMSQFQDFIQNSRIAFSQGETGHWAQLFGMLKVAGLDLPSPIQQAGRLLFALATLVACWLAAYRLSPVRSAFYLYSLSMCYLMLFNSRTEGSTYAMVGPVYGLLLAEAWFQDRNPTVTWGFLIAVIATVFNFDLALLVVKRPNEIWLSPFICVIVSCYLTGRLIHELRSVPSISILSRSGSTT